MTHWTRWDITDIFRTFHSKATEYTFFSSSHGTFSRIDHNLGPKSVLNMYQKIGIIPCIFSDHTALKLELNHKRKFGKSPNTWRLNSILLKNEWVNQEIKDELKNSWKQMIMKTQLFKICGTQQRRF